jgi:hypothetical protein
VATPDAPSSGRRGRPLVAVSINHSQIGVGGAVAQTQTAVSEASSAPKNRFGRLGPLITAVGGLFKGTMA